MITEMWISKIYWTWSPHDCLVYILCTITNCAVHFKPRGVTWGEDYCVLQCTLKTWFHPISFSKKCKVMKTLLNFYPKYYPRLSCTMIDVSAHYGIPPPKKVSSYAFIVYYTKYLIFIMSHLLNLNNLWLLHWRSYLCTDNVRLNHRFLWFECSIGYNSTQTLVQDKHRHDYVRGFSNYLTSNVL